MLASSACSRSSVFTLCLALLASACSASQTEILVVIDADAPLRDQIDVVRARTLDQGGAQIAANDFMIDGEPLVLPFSFVLRPRAGQAAGGDVRLALDAIGDDSVLVMRTVRTSFSAGERRLLRVRLESACRAVPCTTEGMTCVAGTCAPDGLETLPPVDPWRELEDAGVSMDSSTPPDAAPTDAAPSDAAPVDAPMRDAAPVDASGPPPTSCDALAGSGAADGVYSIDPDGEGALAPIDVRCRFEGGRGWTLLAKTLPGETLGFEAPPWTTSGLLNPEDLSLAAADALLRSYGTVPVSELSIQLVLESSGRELVVPVALGRTATLHAILSSGERVDTPASGSAWAAVMGMDMLPASCLIGLNLVGTRAKTRIGALCDEPSVASWGWVGVGGETLDRCTPGMPIRIGSGGFGCVDGARMPRRASTRIWGR